MGSTLNFALLDKLIKLCKKERKRQNEGNLSITWLLFSKGSAFLIAIGFFIICSENVFDKNSMQCYLGANKQHFEAYVVNYCWMHGTFHIEQEMQSKITPCIVNNGKFDDKIPVTKFYIWIPYLLAFLFVLARLPYWIWKRFYSVQMLIILKGDDPHQFIFNFLYYSFKFKKIHRMYSLLETLNTISLMFSIIFTHFVLNQEFILYGFKVFKYFFTEDNLVNPSCHIFPTEVRCTVSMGASTGSVNETNFLCILNLNVFNQFFFFVLWSYWFLILMVSVCGFFYRVARHNVSSISRYVCLKEIENPKQRKKLSNLEMKACEWFTFQFLIDIKDPMKQEEIINELCCQIESYPL